MTGVWLLLGGLLAQAEPPEKALEAAARKTATADSYTFALAQGEKAVLKGKFVKGQPTHFEASGIELFRKGEVIVYRDGREWKKSRTGVLSDPLRVLIAVAPVRKAIAPHEELARLAKDVMGAKASMVEGLTRYEGALRKEALATWAPTEVRGVVQEGSVAAFVDKAGQVVRYTVTLRLQGRIGGAEIDGTSVRTVRLTDIGTTKVVVPPEARKALE